MSVFLRFACARHCCCWLYFVEFFVVCAYFSLYVIIILLLLSMGNDYDDDSEQTTTTTTIFANKAQIFQYTKTHTHTEIERLVCSSVHRDTGRERTAFYRPLGMVLFN